MIKITNLSKTYLNQKVLENINLSFPNKGLVAIIGPSGCGKTTLLNCLSGLISYEGNIQINNKNLEMLSEKELDAYRLKECGFIFQDFRLFNYETAYRNIIFPLEVNSSISKENKNRRVMDLLSLVGLKKQKDKILTKMSGGEKQRVAIARAMVNNPKYVFADEPTGSLDSKNSLEIMKILKKISLNSLIILVSHDESLVRQYANRIIKLSDGHIVYDEINNPINNPSFLGLGNLTYSNKKPIIPFSFLFRHAIIQIKEKKFRNLFTVTMISLGLLAIGLTLSLSSIVNQSVKSSYAALIDEDQIIVENKNPINYKDIESASFYDCNVIKSKYPKYITGIGVNYYVNYENFFSTRNQFYIYKDGSENVIEGLSSRNINEYKFLSDTNETFYPSKPETLNDDEIVLSLTMDTIEDICFSLRIPRSVNSLRDYLLLNELYIVLDVANDNWEYEDEQVLNVKAFSLSFTNCIYHVNPMWNEYLFENCMRFPTSSYLNKVLDLPFYLRKIYYLNINPDLKEEFFILLNNDPYFNKYKFELAKSYYQYLFNEVEIKDINRFLLFLNPSDNTLNIANTHYLKDSSSFINNEIYGTNKGIVIYPSSLLMGFSNNFFASSSKEKIDEVNDINSYLTPEESKNLIIPEEVSMGCFYKIKSEGLSFSSLDKSEELSLDEVIISSSLAKLLFDNEDPINKKIYVSYVTSEMNLGDKKVYKEFVNDELIIKGIKENNNKVIYHNSYWSILYFQLHMGISIFDLEVNNIAFNKLDGYKSIENDFPQYSFIEPMNEINQSVDEIVNYLTIALIAFSLICIVIALLLILLINNLNIIDNQKDIYLARILGISKKESKRFLTTHTLLICTLSFLLSVIELIFVSLFINKFILSTSGLLINPLSLLAMLITTLIMYLMSLLLSSRSYKRI